MSDHMVITMTGADGSSWNLTDPEPGPAGVELRPGPKKLIDAPARTFWIQGASRMHYQGKQFERRDPIFGVNVYADHPDVWRDIDSQFRMALGMYDQQFTITVETPDGVRHLDLRLLSEPTAYESGEWEGKAPDLHCVSTLLISAAAEMPFWYAEDYTESWSLPSGTSGSHNFSHSNPGDIEVWPRYFCTAPGTWTLPDRSWGQEAAYQRPLSADATRTVALPALVIGEDLDVNADPDEEALVAANGALVWARWSGNGLLYPIKPQTPPTSVAVSVSGASTGAAVTMTLPRRFSRPFGVTL